MEGGRQLSSFFKSERIWGKPWVRWWGGGGENSAEESVKVLWWSLEIHELWTWGAEGREEKKHGVSKP